MHRRGPQLRVRRRRRGVRRGVNGPKRFDGDLRADLCRAQVSVSEQLLDVPDARAGVEHGASDRVTDEVAGAGLAHVGSRVVVKPLRHHLGRRVDHETHRAEVIADDAITDSS